MRARLRQYTFSDNLDVIAAIAGCLLGLVIIYLSYAAGLLQYDIGFVLLLASSIYLAIRSKFLNSSIVTSFELSKSLMFLLNILFVVLFAISVLLLWSNLHYRPPAYFVLISLMAALIAAEILFSKRQRWLIILQILLVSLSIRAGIFYEFNLLMGFDIWGHAKWAELVASSGFVSPETILISTYIANPIFHLSLAITDVVTLLTMKDCIFFVIVLFSTIGPVFIYLVGKSIAGPKVGLLAMLAASISDISIVRGVTSITPGSLVFCWFLIILYLIFKDSKRGIVDGSMKFLLIFVLVLTHQLSTFASLIALIGIFLGKVFYDYVYTKRLYHKVPSRLGINVVIILIFAVVMLSHWAYPLTNPSGGNLFGLYQRVDPPAPIQLVEPPAPIQPGEPPAPIQPGEPPAPTQPGEPPAPTQPGGLPDLSPYVSDLPTNPYIVYYSYYSVLSNTLFHFGYLILLLLAIIGALTWLSRKNIDQKKCAILGGVLVLYVCVYGAPLTYVENAGLFTRWLNFVYIFLALLAGQTIFSLAGLFKRNEANIIAISGITFILTFLMITTPYINGDSPLYCKDRWPRVAFTDSEITAPQTITQIYDGEIKIDGSYRVFYAVTSHSEVSTMNVADEKSLSSGLVILRESMKTRPVVTGHAGGELALVDVLGEEFFRKFETPDHNLVYNNREVKAFYGNPYPFGEE